ncbi:hypothetical protein LTR36_004642 [Oleoguttula mirabilis]|uniref:5-formyltetrahydrofolate cyclo-ligase n=1 Tax=Oleoguttula mirabilis TaxID=1507867 RepID=A0AAV9JFX3_9PEZI|nr:hypothetical protein LTR36_004642 [Oleoguttula mirabilis]
MSTEARAGKKALRKDIKHRLSALSDGEVAQQSSIAQTLITSLPQYRDAKRISVYLSMPTGEARTDAIVRDALDGGKEVFVPYVYTTTALAVDADAAPKLRKGKGKVMEMLRLTSVREYEALERDSWGIPHLPADSVGGRENAIGGLGTSLAGAGLDKAGSTLSGEDGGGLDLIVVPGVAFDAEMNRMGHGAGFYDAFLTRFGADASTRKKPFLVGLCLAEQVLPPGGIRMQEWDWRVDAVAVGDGRLLALDGGT